MKKISNFKGSYLDDPKMWLSADNWSKKVKENLELERLEEELTRCETMEERAIVRKDINRIKYESSSSRP